jgi:hypothetical protein
MSDILHIGFEVAGLVDRIPLALSLMQIWPVPRRR